MMNTDLKTLREEIHRDTWLALAAAQRIGSHVYLPSIPTEPLECLLEMIRQELHDRDLRNPQPPINPEPF